MINVGGRLNSDWTRCCSFNVFVCLDLGFQSNGIDALYIKKNNRAIIERYLWRINWRWPNSWGAEWRKNAIVLERLIFWCYVVFRVYNNERLTFRSRPAEVRSSTVGNDTHKLPTGRSERPFHCTDYGSISSSTASSKAISNPTPFLVQWYSKLYLK